MLSVGVACLALLTMDGNQIPLCLAMPEVDQETFVAKSSSLWRPHKARAVFGGQIVAQALVRMPDVGWPGAARQPSLAAALSALHSMQPS